MISAQKLYGETLFNDCLSASDVESVVKQLYGSIPKWCDGALMLNGTIGGSTNLGFTLENGIDGEHSDMLSHCRYALFASDIWHYKSQKAITPGVARSLGIQFSHGMMYGQILYSGKLTEFVSIRRRYVWCRIDGMTVQLRDFGMLNRNKQHIDRMLQINAFDAAISLARRYDWTVTISVDESPSMAFACTPSAARAAYRLRDLAPGKSRRDALLHWVSAHKRREEIDVSEHLRGKIEFSWRGINCKIMPSQFDREKELIRKSLAPRSARKVRL